MRRRLYLYIVPEFDVSNFSFNTGTTMMQAWEIILAGLGSMGTQHSKIHDELNSTADAFEKWRKKESDEKRKIAADGLAHRKELAAYETAMHNHKTNYLKNIKALEFAIQKRNEAMNDPKLKDSVTKLSTKVQTGTN